MERLDVFDIRFGSITDRSFGSADVIVISGGDVGRMSRVIGDEGFLSLLRFVKEGGTYVGLCAGAYLPLRSRHSASRPFQVIDAPISNIGTPEEPSSVPRRYVSRCGEKEVFQPLRGPVRLETSSGEIVAPMFRGPCWHDVPGVVTLARYGRLDRRAELIVPRDLFERTVPGKTAALSVPLGEGRLLLFGPHAEHPGYADANAWILGLLPEGRGQGHFDEEVAVEDPSATKRALSDARIVLTDLQGREWTIGAKVWEAEKAGLFIDAMWRRLPLLEKSRAGVPDEVPLLLERALRSIKAVRADPGDGTEADAMFSSLSRATSAFLNHYFAVLRRRSG